MRVRVIDLETKLKEKEKFLQDVKRDKRMSASLTKGHRDNSTNLESAEVERRQTR